MSTETHFGAPPSQATHAAPSGAFAPPAQPGRARFMPRPESEDDGGISWDRPTSGDLSTVDQPTPRLRQLMGVCAWAAVLGGIGLVIAIRGFIGDLMGLAPDWYEPSMIIAGIAGIGLTVSAFVTVHRNRLPFMLLGGSSVLLLVALILTVVAF